MAEFVDHPAAVFVVLLLVFIAAIAVGAWLIRPMIELPEEQREVFVAHEIEGRSFKEMSAASGVSVNTLLSRKRYAVLHLRERLKSVYEEFMNK